MPRIPSPNSAAYQATSSNNVTTGYPSPSPSVAPHHIPFPQSDSGSSTSSTTQSNLLDFSDFGEALNNFQEAFPSTYGDLNDALGAVGSSASESAQYYSSDTIMDCACRKLSFLCFPRKLIDFQLLVIQFQALHHSSHQRP